MEKLSKLMENTFKLRENGTTVKTEIIAGVTTFMTMAYILAVNPKLRRGRGTTSQDDGYGNHGDRDEITCECAVSHRTSY